MSFIQAPASIPTWKQSYMAALFEVDKNRLFVRIDQAEMAIVLRTRELFQNAGEHQQERRALEAALCALQVLRSISEKNNQSQPPMKRKDVAA